jgi:hypothetical protein
MMRPVTQEERAVGSILDLVVEALRAQKSNDPTLQDMKEYCGQACKIVAAYRKPSPGDGDELTPNVIVPPRRYRQCWF